jgi:hypothetical protein
MFVLDMYLPVNVTAKAFPLILSLSLTNRKRVIQVIFVELSFKKQRPCIKGRIKKYSMSCGGT